tara:strand:+ start:765 stop:1796 length:1032 start_codon:yes stop_codon:yes gene_type:complete
MNNFKAFVLEKKNKISLKDNLVIPKLKKFQVLVKIDYTSVCGSQIFEISGKRGKDKYLPHLLGHEASGVVLEKHKSVKKIKKGDNVILTWIKCNGGEAGGTTINDKNGKTYNAGPITTFSNFAVISENRLIKKPEKMHSETACLFGCCIPTGFGMALNYFKVTNKDKVLIVGLGGIGLSSLIALIHKKPKTIILIDNDKKKINQMKKLGFKNSFYIENKNMDKLKLKLSNSDIDYCIEATGRSQMIEYCFDIIKDNGSLVFASHPEYNKKISLDPHALIRGKRIYGSWGGGGFLDNDIYQYWQIFKKSPISSLFFKKIYTFNELKLSISDFKSKKTLRPIIKI